MNLLYGGERHLEWSEDVPDGYYEIGVLNDLLCGKSYPVFGVAGVGVEDVLPLAGEIAEIASVLPEELQTVRIGLALYKAGLKFEQSIPGEESVVKWRQ